MTDVHSSARCASCGAVLAPGARFCPECGRSTAPRAFSPLPWVLGGLAGLALIALLIFLLRPKPEPTVISSVPQAPSGPPVVAAPPRAPSGPPVTTAPPRPQAPPQPVDPNRAAVEAYLQKMASIEARRKQIVNNIYPAMLSLALLKSMGGVQDMLQMMDEDVSEEQKRQGPPSSVQKGEQTINQYRDQLYSLALEANKIKPPPPALPFHRSYQYSLGAYDKVLADISTAMLAGDQSIAGKGAALSQQVQSMQGAADRELTKLVQRYDLPKPFAVNDQMSGSLTGP